MRPNLRWRWIGFASLALAVMLGVVAMVDHRQKTVRMNRAEAAEWYCTHVRTRCGGPSSDGIERRWNRREIGYEAAFALLGAFGAASVVASRRR